MSWDRKRDGTALVLIVGVFLAAYHLPLGEASRFPGAVLEGFHLLKDYAREHILLCVVPALFIAGAIGVFVSQAAVMRYLGPKANRVVAYAVAAVSGTVLAVCSCTVLPLFAGIYKRGAGLGPATAFLYAGPAINVLAIILTARLLGLELGLARVIGAVGFSVVVGLLMHLFFRREEEERVAAQADMPDTADEDARPLRQTVAFFATMIGILIFANWAKPEQEVGWWMAVHGVKWWVTGILAAALGTMLWVWYRLPLWQLAAVAAASVVLALLVPGIPELAFTVGTVGLGVITVIRDDEAGDWFDQSWGFAKQILPLLMGGVFVAGVLLGRPGLDNGLIPSAWVEGLVGGNSLAANAFAAVSGAFMYFATLTELPILQTLMGSGMGHGPALALLLAGPALSLPSMLVLASIMGVKKTAVFVVIVVVVATLTGWGYGAFFPAAPLPLT